MQGRVQTLESLRQRVAVIETRSALAGTVIEPAPPGLLSAPRGALHEVFADGLVDAGAALGYALAQAHRYIEPARPGLLILQLKADTQELGLPYGLGLRSFGLDTRAIVFIRTDTIVELLWAMEEAIACRAVAAVVADIAYPHKALDFTASRRLSLRAEASGTSVFVVRYARDREASGAKYRWRVRPEVSAAPPFDDKAPGPPRWRVTLEKGSLGGRRRATAEGKVFLVDWIENDFALANDTSRDRAGASDVAALSGAASAKLGYRLSEAG